MDQSPGLLVVLIDLKRLIELVSCQVLQLLLVNATEGSATCLSIASCGLPRLIVVHLYYYNLFEF